MLVDDSDTPTHHTHTHTPKHVVLFIGYFDPVSPVSPPPLPPP